MTTSTADYEDLLREAIRQAKASAPQAVDDLLRCASSAAEAVTGVTGGGAALELVPINQEEHAQPVYQLQLRKLGSEAPPSDLGIFCVTATGYPIHRWASRNGWEANPEKPGRDICNADELANLFKGLLSSPQSRLVVLVTFFQQLVPPSSGEHSGPR